MPSISYEGRARDCKGVGIVEGCVMLRRFACLLLLALVVATEVAGGGRVTRGRGRKAMLSGEKCPTVKDMGGKYTTAGKLLYEAGRVSEALECLHVAAEKDESDLTLVNLASVQTAIGDYASSQKTINRAKKNRVSPLTEAVFRAEAKNLYFWKSYMKCIEVAEEWAEHYTGSSEPLLLMASSHYELRQSLTALEFYEKALLIDPNNSAALVNSALILNNLGRHSDAAEVSKRALTIDPSLVEAHVSHSAALITMKRYSEAIHSLEEALKLRPSEPQIRCKLINTRRLMADWSSYEEDLCELSSILTQQLSDPQPFLTGEQQLCHTPGNLLHFPLSPSMHKKLSWVTSQRDYLAVAEMRKVIENKLKKKLSLYRRATTLRVGFVSFDYKNHPASHIMLHVFKNLHQMDSVEVIAYSLNSYHDFWTTKIRDSVTQFRDISSLTLQESAEQILNDNIHILIDLMGFSAGGKTALFALRAAPLQIAYMGYPGTTGSLFMDYVICDPTACDPQMVEEQFSEKVIFLPEPYFLSPMAPASEPSMSLEAFYSSHHLPREGFIFCCLSQLGKLDKPTFKAWMDILRHTNDSYLWLLRRPLEAEANILKEARQYGSGLHQRIVFTEKLPREQFLHYAPKVCHLFLDTHLYNSHTVAAEVLQGGLPVLTYPGVTMASRVAASLVNSLGFAGDLVVEDYHGYVERAVHLRVERGELKRVREGIMAIVRGGDARLFYPAEFTGGYAQGLLLAWDNFKRRKEPDNIDVSVHRYNDHRSELK